MINTPTGKNQPGSSSITLTAAEADLRSCLHQQSLVFENAVKVIERLEYAANRRELGNPDSVSQLQKALTEVVATQQKVSAAHVRYSSFKAAPGIDVRQALERHELHLKTLIARIDKLQGIYEEVRAELTPQLDTESRHRNMQTAYQKSMRNV